jgi:uncharacterized membrane protein
MSQFWISARRSFFAGLVVVGPIAASVIVLLWLFNWLTNFLLPRFIRAEIERLPYPEFLFRLVALVLCMVLVTLIGWVTRRVIGKQAYAVVESLLGRVPLLNRIYGFMKEVSQTMLAGKKTVFQRVVLVEYPREGVWLLGLVTNERAGEPEVRLKKDLISVFLPTTPNPTSGWLALVPRDQTVDLDMSVAEAIKMILSGGTIVPPYPPPPAPGVPQAAAQVAAEGVPAP